MRRCAWSGNLTERTAGHARRLSGTRRNDDDTVNETDDPLLIQRE